MAKGMGPTASYVAGGYRPTPASASKFFRRPEIDARVREIIAEKHKIEARATDKAVEKLAITKEWILDMLRYNAIRAQRGQPILDKNGVQIPGQFTGKPDISASNRALELLGRERGLFINKHEVGKPGDFDHLSDDELEVQARRMALELGIAPPSKLNGKTQH